MFALYVQLACIALALFAIIWYVVRVKNGSLTARASIAKLLIFLIIDLIAFGAFTRLTQSGLGCPDWPGCYGQSNPFLATDSIMQAFNAMPHGPVSPFKAWIEMLHRYFAMTVGLLIIAKLYLDFRYFNKLTKPVLKQVLKSSIFNMWVILVLVCIQGAFGAWTVTYKLQPIIVSTHLLLALILLFFVTVHAVLYHGKHLQDFNDALKILKGQPANKQTHLKVNGSTKLQQKTKQLTLHGQKHRHTPINQFLKRLRIVLSIGLITLIIQIILGAWVSTHEAVFGCTQFPTCNQDIFWPELSKQTWLTAFGLDGTLWRSMDFNGVVVIAYDVLTAIHLAHRGFAIIVTILLGLGLGYAAHVFKHHLSAFMQTKQLSHLIKLSYAGIVIIIAQLITGASNVILGYPLLAALLHTVGAALLVYILARLLAFLYYAGRSYQSQAKN